MKPSTRTFLWAAVTVVAVIPLALLRMVFWMRSGAAGVDSGPLMAELAIGTAIALLGILIAWFRLLRDRKERRSRPKPLDLD